jgi:hypothetical protein
MYNDDLTTFSRSTTSSFSNGYHKSDKSDYDYKYDYKYKKYDYDYKYDYKKFDDRKRYSDVIGDEFKVDWNKRVVKKDKSEYYFRYSRYFGKYEAVKCYDSAPAGKFLYVKCK